MVTKRQLETILITGGVNSNHIEDMKNIFFEKGSFYNKFFRKINTSKIRKKVPVDKIIGIDTAWSVAEKSVYECFMAIADDSELRENSSRTVKRNRLYENIDSLIEHGIEFQFSFYESEEEHGLRAGLPMFSHFYNHERNIDCYFSDATHRTISAKMFGAPFLAGYVTEYELNKLKLDNFLFMEKKLRLLFTINHNLKNISIIESDRGKGSYLVTYFDELELFRSIVKIPDLEDVKFPQKLSNEIEHIIENIKELDNQINSNFIIKIIRIIKKQDNFLGKSVTILLKRVSLYKRYNDVTIAKQHNIGAMYKEAVKKIIYHLMEE